jgi:dihydroorotase
MTYDLLLRGGHVLDPGRGLDARLDIAITGGRIAAIEPSIPVEEAKHVIDAHRPSRYVVPGLLDIHTHVAYGATTPGVGMACVDPDLAGIGSGVTTVVDVGSVGVANVGVFGAHILPRARTRVLVYVNLGSFAHTTSAPDIARLEDIDRAAILRCIEASPGLIAGIKLRLVGPIVHEAGETVVEMAKRVSNEAGVPLMVHIGDRQWPDQRRATEVTRRLVETLGRGDILTHLCTPHPGGVHDADGRPLPALEAARSRGVIFDAALGRGNFGFETAVHHAELGLHPDTISSDITRTGRRHGVGLLDGLAKFMAVGYRLADVIRMATANAAAAIGMADQLGAIAVGREADLSIIDVVGGDWQFTDTLGRHFGGQQALVPVHTVRAGDLVAPDWGPYPGGWLPPLR